MSSLHKDNVEDDVSVLNLNQCKIYMTVFGDVGVGKSTLIMKFTKGEFVEFLDPTIETLFTKSYRVDDTIYNFEILDTYNVMINLFEHLESNIKKSNVFLLVFNLNQMETLYSLEEIIREILTIKGLEEFPMVLVGTKLDFIERDVNYQEIEHFSKTYKIPFIKTSAKNSINVDETFLLAIEESKKNPTRIENAPNSNKSLCQLM